MKGQITGQMSIEHFLPRVPQPGDWYDEGSFCLGEPISFDDIQPGMLIWANKSTVSDACYWKCLLAEELVKTEWGDRWIMYDGTRQRELHDRRYWDKSGEIYRRMNNENYNH